MKDIIKRFFGVNNNEKFYLEWMDVSTLLIVINVTLICAGVQWAPIVGIINASACIVVNVIKRGHINGYVLNFALLMMNIYFLH